MNQTKRMDHEKQLRSALLLGVALQSRSPMSAENISALWEKIHGAEASDKESLRLLDQMHLGAARQQGWQMAFAELVLSDIRRHLAARMRFMNLESRSLDELQAAVADAAQSVSSMLEVKSRMNAKGGRSQCQ